MIFVLQTLNNFFVVFFYTLLTIIWLHKTHLILLSKLPRWKTSKWMEQSTLEFWLVLSFVFWWFFFCFVFFLLKQIPSICSLEHPFLHEIFPPTPSWPYRKRVNKPLHFQSQESREIVYKASWTSVRRSCAYCYCWLHNVSHTNRQKWTSSNCLSLQTPSLPICYILSHFIQNQRLVTLGACSAHLKIRRLKLHTLYPIGRMSSFLHYYFPLLCTVDIRTLKNSIRAVISKTELVYSHAKSCSFYPLNRLTNWMW